MISWHDFVSEALEKTEVIADIIDKIDVLDKGWLRATIFKSADTANLTTSTK